MTELESRIIFSVGPLDVAGTVVTTWLVMGGLAIIAAVAGNKLKLYPAGWQVALETAAAGVDSAISEVMGRDPKPFFPLIATMWLMIAVANLTGMVPGLISPTRDMSTAGALAAVSFFSVHYFGIRFSGFRGYVRHYFEPVFVLFPFHVISELSRTLALMLRLFGNILSGEMVAGVLLLVAGFLVPVPFALLEFVVALIQAYIFGMLTLIFIAAGIRTAEEQVKKEA